MRYNVAPTQDAPVTSLTPPYLPPSFAHVSNNRSLIRAVRFPSTDPQHGGQPKPTDDLFFTYYPDGQLATRTDALGNTFSHSYNERTERVCSVVDEPAITGNSPVPIPPDRSSATKFTYDALQRPVTVTAESIANNGGGSYTTSLIGQTAYEYDGLGNLTKEYQAHGSLVQSGTPCIEYTWQFAPESTFQAGSNYSRLGSMKYPQWVGFSRQRTLQFTHGVAGSIDDELGRVTKVHDNYNVSGYAHATYAYAGSGRRIQTEYGSNGTTFAAKQSFALSGQPGYPLLDRFGRVADVQFTRSSDSATLYRARYGYDAADSRLFARITQYETGSTPHDNDRSWLYGYDTLNRLTSASLGALDTTNTAITTTNPRLIQWNLDTLGNWNGGDIQTGGGLAGKTVSYDTSIPPNGTYDDPTTYTHATDTRNELDSLTVQTPGGPATTTFYYDANGNLVNDGPDGFFYQYDAHNRLVQVNKRGSLQFNADGTILSGDPGAWVAHYTYDGVGRLIRKQVPWNYIRTALRAEAYYYDGVRRIQEVFTDPKPGTFPEKVHQGDPPPNPVYITATRGEFIWAPGGGAPGYVDELICQITPLNAPQYVLQDANYNAVALVDLAGTVLSQFTYDPYGEPIIAEQGINGTASQVMDLRVGHQGLFLDRLNLLGNGALDESGATGSNWTIAAPTGGLGNRALYQNRGRSYSAGTGRFLQKDPNGLATSTSAVIPFFGSSPFLDIITASHPNAVYVDGLSLYSYLGSRPLNYVDPSGLDFTLTGVLKAGAIGGAVGGAANGAVARLYKGKSWGDTFIAAGKGALAGFVGGAIGYSFGAAFFAGEGYGAIIGGSAAGGGGAGLTQGLLNGHRGKELAKDTFWGVAIGGFTGLMGSAILSRTDISISTKNQLAEVLDWLNKEVFDSYLSSTFAGFGSMTDEIRNP